MLRRLTDLTILRATFAPCRPADVADADSEGDWDAHPEEDPGAPALPVLRSQARDMLTALVTGLQLPRLRLPTGAPEEPQNACAEPRHNDAPCRHIRTPTDGLHRLPLRPSHSRGIAGGAAAADSDVGGAGGWGFQCTDALRHSPMFQAFPRHVPCPHLTAGALLGAQLRPIPMSEELEDVFQSMDALRLEFEGLPRPAGLPPPGQPLPRGDVSAVEQVI